MQGYVEIKLEDYKLSFILDEKDYGVAFDISEHFNNAEELSYLAACGAKNTSLLLHDSL